MEKRRIMLLSCFDSPLWRKWDINIEINKCIWRNWDMVVHYMMDEIV